MEIPIPIIFETVPPRFQRGVVVRSIARAAAKIGTLFVADGRDAAPGVSFDGGCAVPVYRAEDIGRVRCAAPMVMVPYGEEVLALQARIKEESPNTPRGHTDRSHAGRRRAGLPVDPGRASRWSNSSSTPMAANRIPSNPRHMRDVLREVHRALTKEGTRDLVTLIASGGIAQAEHVAKAIICGADLVAIDLPLMIALECRLCGECERGESLSHPPGGNRRGATPCSGS